MTTPLSPAATGYGRNTSSILISTRTGLSLSGLAILLHVFLLLLSFIAFRCFLFPFYVLASSLIPYHSSSLSLAILRCGLAGAKFSPPLRIVGPSFYPLNPPFPILFPILTFSPTYSSRYLLPNHLLFSKLTSPTTYPSANLIPPPLSSSRY